MGIDRDDGKASKEQIARAVLGRHGQTFTEELKIDIESESPTHRRLEPPRHNEGFHRLYRVRVIRDDFTIDEIPLSHE